MSSRSEQRHHNPHHDEDSALLEGLGYKQELTRRFGGFSNFAVSFSIISVLAGCITSYGIAMAAMNIFLYLAIERIPLGIAVTLEFLGPTAVALLASRRLPEFLCAGLALVGVGLVSLGPSDGLDPLGCLFALLAGVFFAAYAVLASRVGKSDAGFSGLALSVSVASLVTLPWAVTHMGAVNPGQWWLLAVSAVLGVALPFLVDTVAGGLTSPRVVGTLFALDPVIGSVIGLLVLDQALGWVTVAGIVLVAAAGALLVWSAEREPSGAPVT